MRKKKVMIFYSGALFGGIDTMLINLAPKFYEEYEVVLAYANRESVSSIIFKNKPKAKCYKVPFKKWTFIFGVIYLIYIIWKEKIDILFTQEIVLSVICRIAKFVFPRLIHVTSICSNIRIFTNVYTNAFINAVLFINKKTQYLIDKYICISYYLSNYLQSEGIEAEKVEVIHLGLSRPLKIEENRSKRNIWSVAYVGRIAHEKGTDIFLSIADYYLDKYLDDNIDFHLYGCGEYCHEYIASMQKKYPSFFIAHGFVERLYEDPIGCLIVPSRDEGLSYVVIEAFKRKIPVISSNKGALPELIIPNKTGIICDNNDILQYIDAIRKIKNDWAFRNELTENAYKMAAEKYTKETMQKKYIALFGKLCS